MFYSSVFKDQADVAVKIMSGLISEAHKAIVLMGILIDLIGE
jgi:hypothetical protein